LTNSNLFGSNATIASLTATTLTNSNLFGSNATITGLTATTLTNSNLFGSNATIASLTATTLTNSNLFGSNATITGLTATTLTNSNLFGSNATVSNVTSSNIFGSNVTGTTLNGTTIVGNNVSFSNLTVSSSAVLNGSVVMNSDLTINGSVVFVNSSNMVVSDNIITLNNGLVGAPTVFTTTGFELKRGSASNSFFVLYDESAKLLRAGFSNSTASSLNAVSTRADGLTAGYTYYDVTSCNLINRTLVNSDITNAPWVYSTSNVYYTDLTGSVGIGITSPSYKLHVVGVAFANDFKASSDRRLKKDFQLISSALDKIHQISGYTFSRLTGEKRFAGVIAQEMQAVLPEVVDTDADGFLNVSYGNIVALLIQGIKELDDKVTKLIG
jgi:uncharacterized protein YjbI with pentapeptide repeats